ncbi:hypothetical protein GCM10018952_02390 [Streptosporangium vulgare]
MNPLCLDQGVGLIPWNPLARGLLARAGSEEKTTRTGSDPRIDSLYDDADNDRLILDRAAQVAREREVAPARVALSWLLHQPGLSAPVVGATKDHHVDDAVAAVDLSLTEKELAFLAEPYRPRVVKH